MSVAECLGVADVDGPLMLEARLGWGRWCAAEPELDIVEDLLDLPRWTRGVSRTDKDRVLGVLSQLAREDQAAAIALTWMLHPAGVKLAHRLRDLSLDIDALVGGQLWLEIAGGKRIYNRSVAANVMTAVEDAVRAELAAGRSARRRDPAWSNTIVVADFNADSQPLCDGGDAPDERELLAAVVQEAVLAEVITELEASLLLTVAEEAHDANAPQHRGRGGLTTPRVTAELSRRRAISTRTMRRRVTDLVDRVSAFSRDHVDLGDIEHWYGAHEHRPISFLGLIDCYDDVYYDEQMRLRYGEGARPA